MTPRVARSLRNCKASSVACWLLLLFNSADALRAQDEPSSVSPDAATAEADQTAPPAPEKVEVQPAADDGEIEKRLTQILTATEWFPKVEVSVREGVVFFDGIAGTEESQQWATDLARKTEGVVAIVNRMEIDTPSAWDFSPARDEIDSLARGFIRSLPLVVVALVVIGLAWLAARVSAAGLRQFLRRRVTSRLLREVAARTVAIIVLLLGFYFVLRIWGLTRLAVTLIGGTGLVGLILGIAFRDITENFLASLYLSLQQPFREGDLIQIADTTGYVQRLTSRTTVVITLDGNQVQVPNATVFKSVICNFTSNPNRRQDFVVGIGYNDAISHAQEVALEVLAKHPAVLADPEPWVLVDNLGTATVNLRVYFWLDGTRHSWLKVRSSVVRLVKRAFQDAGISLPDESREVIFPEGVPLRMIESELGRADAKQIQSPKPAEEPDLVSTRAEGELQSDALKIKEQARGGWSPEQGENLLADEDDPDTDT